jgi:rhomboid protease GluP
MSATEASNQDVIEFYASNKSQIGKAQKWLWLSSLFGVLIVVATQKNGTGLSVFTIGFVVLISGGLWLYLRSQMKPGTALVVIEAEGIQSPLFSGGLKQLSWTEIDSVEVKAEQNAKSIEFKLAESVGKIDKRNFWHGRNEGRPTILLSAFDEQAQEKLLSAINFRLKQLRGDGGVPHEFINELTVEREFQAQLTALAPTPWLTYTLIASNALIWLLTVSQGAGLLVAGSEKLLVWGGNAASEVQRGEWWRLLSSTFLHSGVMHVAMNMLGLAAAGITVERIYGQRLFALIYFGSGLSGSALSLHFSAQNAVSVGASGAVFGVTGALLVAVFQHRKTLPKTFSKQTLSSLSFFILYSLMQGFANQGIDNAAHVGGLLGGCFLAFLLPERFNMPHFVETVKRRTIAGFIIIFVATFGVASSAPTAKVDQVGRMNSQAAFVKAVNDFDKAMALLKLELENIKSGKMTELESDNRSRTVHAPVFREVLSEFNKVTIDATDPRLPFFRDMKRMTELLAESLAMESIYLEGNEKPQPADPVRMDLIQQELSEVALRVQKFIERQNKPAAK